MNMQKVIRFERVIDGGSIFLVLMGLLLAGATAVLGA